MLDETAARHLQRFLEPKDDLSDDVETSLSRCREAMRGKEWGPEVFTKALHDLDTAFLNNHLRGLIKIVWVTPNNYDPDSEMRDHNEHSYAWTSYCSKRRSHIHMNATSFFTLCADPEKDMWRVLLHEMLVSMTQIARQYPLRSGIR